MTIKTLSLPFVPFFLITFGFLAGCQSEGQPSQEYLEPIQTLPMNEISLTNLESFESTAENWMVAGGVESNRKVKHDLQALEGTGTLVNIPAEEAGDHLFTDWTHGDLELELDFLMPKGSNSGVYLMGRYEVQLLDSWGIEEPEFSDLGGIYQRWNESESTGYEGHAPAMNASLAPGLWQHLKILFKAPEFNEQGEKVANAEFEEVWVNGVLVQENVEVTGPTRAAAFNDEKPVGPLMIQGDHGPVALRNIMYKRYDKEDIELKGLKYEYYSGAFDQIPDFDTLQYDSTSMVDSLSGNIEGSGDRYALRYTGTIETPNAGTYLFKLRNAGTVRMIIGGTSIFEQDTVYRLHQLVSKTTDLQAGSHDFILEYINHPNNWYSGLSLEAEGPRLRLQNMHAPTSVPDGGKELPDQILEVKDRVKLLRAFGMHKGIKRTHVVNTGAPNGINYNYDLGQSALLHAWEGPFVNTNEMWINRGQPQIAKPAGPAITFVGEPIIATLTSGTAAWPDSISWEQLNVEGYSIKESGWPVFKYSVGDISIEDYFEGSNQERRLVREVRIMGSSPQENMWLQMASGEDIIQNENEYVVDDRSYYLNILNIGGLKPKLAEAENSQYLRLPLLRDTTEIEIRYEIIW